MADYLRLITLYKFGGIYFNFNVIVLRNIGILPANFVAAISDEWVSNGVMGFESDSIGHKIVEMVLRCGLVIELMSFHKLISIIRGLGKV